MVAFDSNRLTVEYRDGAWMTAPIISRSHTLTHSDFTGQLFLTIGTQFAWDKVDPILRDEVLGIWTLEGNTLMYNVFVLLNKEDQDIEIAMKRYDIFERELPLALTAIRYGDRYLFERYPPFR